MNETIKTIMERFSCRDFESTALTDEQIAILTDAALASPSALNLQPWQVIMITDKKLIDEMGEEAINIFRESEDQTAYNRIMERGGIAFYNAPCMMMVPAAKSEWASLDCGILSQNVSLAAHAIGLGSVICGMARVPLEGPRGGEFLKRMNFPNDYVFGISILIGYVKTSKEPHELDKSKVTFVKGD